MTKDSTTQRGSPQKTKHRPFRRAVLRGLAVVLPPLLTIVIFLWVWNTIQVNVLRPVEDWGRYFIYVTWYKPGVLDILPSDYSNAQVDAKGHVLSFDHAGQSYVSVGNRQWLRRDVYDAVSENPGKEMPTTAEGICHRYIDLRFLRPQFVYPLFLIVFLVLLSLLGRFLAAGIGRMVWNAFEQIIHRLPLIRNVYGSVKQVTDFIFSESEIEYTRVVAVEYPRKGIWSLGFVTGESMLDISSAANEPVLSVLMPTSPMPATGFTVTVKKSETVDLSITVDQALQFIVSCGVVVPPSQQADAVRDEVQAAVARHISTTTADASVSSDDASTDGERRREVEEPAAEESPIR